MSGIYYYKLISEYPNDVTKNCKLTVNEIDNNFKVLKDEDIKSAELDKDTSSVILTRNNGDKLVVDLTPILSGSVYDLEVVYENPSSGDTGSCKGASIYITYSTLTENDEKATVTVPITGLVTTENLNTILGGGLLTKVISDGTLTGEGTLNSPLGIKGTELNRPAVKLIDKTKGELLPETFTKGTRYITKEYVSDFGFLYNYDAVLKIQEKLDSEGKGWRIPTKADWDCLLNSIEPCDYRDHSSSVCHQILGKYAGKKLKSVCGWKGSEDCECKTTKPLPGQHCHDEQEFSEPGLDPDEEFDADTAIDPEDATPQPINIYNCDGTDDFGMRILPTGYGDEEGRVYYETETTVFWTSTHVYNDLSQDLYVKKFDWNKCGVVQEALCTGDRNSIRLVKDYTGSNHEVTEMIDGDNYNTILFPDCGTIWTASNFAGTNPKYHPTRTALTDDVYRRVVYFINVWNGTEWEKRALNEGETVVLMEGNENCQYNIEYRVYMEDECNQVLVNTDDTVFERVMDKVIDIIEEEKDARIKADEELWEALNEEISARTEADRVEKEEREAADEILQEQINAEVIRAEQVEQELWEAINKEAQAREEVDQQLWEAINQEAQAREEVDQQLWEALNNEISGRTEVDQQMWEAINNEINARLEVEAQLWDGLNGETARAQEVEAQLWDGINGETERAQDVEGQLWTALNNEIERATSEEARIECQIIDNPENPLNEATAEQVGELYGKKYFVLRANGGLTLTSKCANANDISIRLDANFGTF